MSGWTEYKLGDLLEIKHGFAFKGKFFSASGKYILLTPGNFLESGGLKLKGDKEKYYLGDFPQEYLLEEGDLIVAMTDLTQNAPILGSPALIPESNLFLHNQRLGKLININESKVNKSFLYHLFNTRNVREQIKGSATGATVRHTAPSRIYDVAVQLPSLEKQKEIANILDVYTQAIENNNQRISILETLAQNIYQEWFVNFRYPNPPTSQANTPLPPLSTGALRDLQELTADHPYPEGWEIKKLVEICNLTMGQSPKSEFYNETEEGSPFFQGVRDFGIRFPKTSVWCTKPTRFAQKGDILFSVRAPVGRLNIAGFNLSIGRGLCAINHKQGYQAFLYQQLKSIFTTEDMIGNGAIFNSVTKKDMEDIKLICPPQNLIESFEKIANPIFQQLDNLSLRNENLKQQRDLLLPRLISG